MTNKQKGLTLIEMMVTIAILSIIVTIGITAYDAQKLRGYRQEAIRALTEMSIREERWFSQNGKYTGDINDVYSGTTSERGKYNLSITFNNATPEEYILVATATGTQADDTDCARLTLNHLGERLSYNSSNALTTRNCWAK